MVEDFSIAFPVWLATHPRAAHQPEDQTGLRSHGGLSGEGIAVRLRFGESRGLPDRGLATLPGFEGGLCWPRASGVEAWHRTCQIASPWDGQAMLGGLRPLFRAGCDGCKRCFLFAGISEGCFEPVEDANLRRCFR